MGGIVALAFGATELGTMASLASVNVARLLSLSGPLFALAVGVVALVSASRIKEESINIVLAVLGFITLGVGGVLIAISGLVAIISRHTMKTPG